MHSIRFYCTLTVEHKADRFITKQIGVCAINKMESQREVTTVSHGNRVGAHEMSPCSNRSINLTIFENVSSFFDTISY